MTAFPYPPPGKWPPDYVAVFQWRQAKVLAMRQNPVLRIGMREYYRTRPDEFIDHWVSTYDPRNAGTGKLATMPLVQFQRQRELIWFIQQLLAVEANGLIEKCRDMGATWDCAAFSVWAWLFVDGISIGWGSREQDLVDKLGDADSIFEKMRIIIRLLPAEFLPRGFSEADHMPFMRIINPETGATITGDIGKNIGRGGRKRLYFVDEAAHLQHQEGVEAALSETTRVRVDISSVNGLGNVFHRKRETGVEWSPFSFPRKHKTNVFIMDWRDHPEKTEEWYWNKRKEYEEKGLLHLFAQEIDRDYASSVEGVIIRAEWVNAAIDAHKVLGFDDEGRTFGGLDVADEGQDRNAATIRKGPIARYCEDWAQGDTGDTARKAADIGRNYVPLTFFYDSIGVGAGVKAETNRLRSERLLPNGVDFVPWAASAKVLNPDSRLIPGDRQSPLNKDYFANLKAQAWWQVARRFERTFKAVTQGVQYDPGDLVSLPSDLPNLQRLKKELSQATQGLTTGAMKMTVNKKPDGTRSPNLADSFVMAYWPIPSGALRYDQETLR